MLKVARREQYAIPISTRVRDRHGDKSHSFVVENVGSVIAQRLYDRGYSASSTSRFRRAPCHLAAYWWRAGGQKTRSDRERLCTPVAGSVPVLRRPGRPVQQPARWQHCPPTTTSNLVLILCMLMTYRALDRPACIARQFRTRTHRRSLVFAKGSKTTRGTGRRIR